MNYKYLIILLISFIISGIGNSYSQINKILLKVNNEIITSLDLFEETKYLKALNVELENTNKETIYEIAEKSLVRHKIKKIELENKLDSYNVNQEILDELLLKQFSKLNISTINELNKFLIYKNIDREHVSNRVKIDILWNEFIYAKYSKKIKIDIDEIKKQLQSKAKEEEFLLSEILFNLSMNENLEQKFKQIQKTIKERGFSETALSFSESSSSDNGGRIGWIRETTLNKKISNQLNKIKVGDYTKPIVVPGGFLILKIEEKKESEIELDLNKAIKEISQKKINEQLNQYSSIYFNKARRNVTINEF